MNYEELILIEKIKKENGVYIFLDTGNKVTGRVFFETEGAKNEMNLKNGLLHGEQKKWDSDDGRLWQVENYENGIKDGYFKCWGWNRKLSWEYKYVMGVIEYSRKYHENGELSSEHIADKEDVFTRKYWENGQLQCEKITSKDNILKSIKNFSENGISIGSVELINGNGTLNVENTLQNGTMIKYSENYKSGELDGLKTSWINGALNYIENYKEGLKDGLSEHWYSNGQIHKRINYKSGQVDGLYQSWLYNGNLMMEGYETMGKKNGSWKFYHDNGQIEREECYVDDLAHGIRKEFDDKGVLLKSEHFICGKKVGIQKFFSADGSLINETNLVNGNGIIITTKVDVRIEETYVDGYLSNLSIYDNNSELQMEENWKNGKLHGPTRILVFDSISKDICNESYREENYRNGELHGLRTALTKYGTVKYKELWENGELIHRQS
jgi:antitoxin component YwqK of YwqJK toxin-antitoxin module